MTAPSDKQRKIIHVDMDCFYAAIEIRDRPELKNKPVAVSGPAHSRGVICTCNYIARQYGVHSAMATATALRLCKDLVLLPVNMAKYRQVAKNIQQIFAEFTPTIEPLSLDEAYLDVSNATQFRGSATLIAQAIRQRIKDAENLTASAGVAPNKFLAKIASGWKKPDGLFVITPNEIADFIKTLPVTELYGVGKITAEKLHRLGLKTCYDLQQYSLPDLTHYFGKLGQHLYEQARGVDHRLVEANRERKSLSVERTFAKDIDDVNACIAILEKLHHELNQRLSATAEQHSIKNQFIKIKFSDFKRTTAESISNQAGFEQYLTLFQNAYNDNKAIRLLGLGVHFHSAQTNMMLQQSLFN